MDFHYAKLGEIFRKIKLKTICVIGLGYIGLPTAVLFALKGFKVLGFDINETIVKNINNCKSHIVEKDLDTSLEEVVKNNYLIAKTKPSEADVYIISVPTPHYLKENGMFFPDITKIVEAINSISPLLKQNDLIILESTSPVGTTEKVHKLILENTKLKNDQINIAYCPERVLPGNIFNELKNNDRVIGGLTKKCSEKAKEIYSCICEGKFFFTNPNTAEMVKLSENAFRDVNIAFANELSMICNSININMNELINLSNRHPRVNILNPGCGVGGHCIAIDPWFIASQFPSQTPLIQTARNVNTNKTLWVLRQIKKLVQDFSKNEGNLPVIGCLGLTYKSNIDDLRESPALKITQNLIEDKLEVFVADPNIKEHENIVLYDFNEVIEKSDLVFILVAHREFDLIKFDNKKIFNFSGS